MSVRMMELDRNATTMGPVLTKLMDLIVTVPVLGSKGQDVKITLMIACLQFANMEGFALTEFWAMNASVILDMMGTLVVSSLLLLTLLDL